MSGSGMGYAAPRALDEALALLAAEAGPAVAGGTDLYPSLGEQPVPPGLVDLTGLPELRGIAREGGFWRIGAGESWAAIAALPFPPGFEGLREAARVVGGAQIQNAGTIGGNLCTASPAADGVPPLLTLGAEVEIAGPGGRRRLPLDEFLLGPRRTALRAGEILLAILIPEPPSGVGAAFEKLGARTHLVISIVSAAALVSPGPGGRIAEARIAIGAASPVARRLTALEARLAGADPSALNAPGFVTSTDVAPLAPIDDVRATAAYRREAAAELARRALLSAARRAGLAP